MYLCTYDQGLLHKKGKPGRTARRGFADQKARLVVAKDPICKGVLFEEVRVVTLWLCK